MKEASIFCIFLLSVMFVGCLPDTSGESPPDDQLIYPVGLVTTASDDYLIVANSNFDLKYNAGTLVAISLDKLAKIQQTGGSEEWKSPGGEYY